MGSRGESRSDMEAELESEEPIEMGDDMSASEDEGDMSATVTSVEHHEPADASIISGRDMETCGTVPESRKHAMSEDTTLNREAKQEQSPGPSEVSLTSRPLL